MGQIIRYQPSVQPNSAIASPEQTGRGFQQIGADVQDGLQAALGGLRQYQYQDRLVKQNTMASTAEQIAGDVKNTVAEKMDSAFKERVQKKSWAEFHQTSTPLIDNEYSDKYIQDRIRQKFDGEPPKEMLSLVRDKLGYSRGTYYEDARKKATTLNIMSDAMDTETSAKAFQKSVMSGTPAEMTAALDAHKAHLEDRVSRLTLDHEKVPALLASMAESGLRTRMARDLEAGSLTGFEDHKKLLEQWTPYLTEKSVESQNAALRGDKKAYEEARLEDAHRYLATANGVIPPEHAGELAQTFGVPFDKMDAAITSQNLASVARRNAAELHHETALKKNSAQTLDQLTLGLSDAYGKGESALQLRLDALNIKYQASKYTMTEPDRTHFENRLATMEKNMAERPTDPLAYGKALEFATLHSGERNVLDVIAGNPHIGRQKKLELMGHVNTLRSKFADEGEKQRHEIATATYQLKSGAFSEVSAVHAAAAQTQILSVLSDVLTNGEKSERPYIRQQWVKYNQNPAEFMDGLIVEQLKVAKKLTTQDGQRLFEGLERQGKGPTSSYHARIISKNEFDTTTDEGKNAALSLQMYMNSIKDKAPQRIQQQQDSQDANALKEAAKKLERKK